MIEIMFGLLLFLCISLFIIRLKILNIIALLLYSSVFLLIAILALIKINFNDILFIPDSLVKIMAFQNIEISYFFKEYFKIDSLNIIFLLILSILSFGISIYNIGFIKKSEIDNRRLSLYSIFLMIFIYSMTCVILSSHLALFWVFIEATTLASAYLIYFEKTKSSLEAAWKYIFICSIGISLAFVGIILLSIGLKNINSLFFMDLYNNAKSINPFWLKLSFAFILVGFGTKMGLAPIHAWLPDAHSESPSPVSALLSGTLLNMAFLGILRVYKIIEISGDVNFAKILLLIMGFFSIMISAVFIVKINNYKRMLAYSSIENMGIIAIGIGIGGIGLYASILHLILHSLIKSSFFLTSGNIYHIYKTKQISMVRGILKKDRITGWLWILSFVCISGIPPFPLFISEFLIIKGMFEQGLIIMAIFFIILLTIIIFGLANSVLKMSFGENVNGTDRENLGFSAYLPQILFLLILVIIGLYMPDFLNTILKSAALTL